jgi:TonB family protein
MIPHFKLSQMKSISALGFALLFFSFHTTLSFGKSAIQQETFEQAVESAKTAMSNNKFKDAKKKLQQALKINKESAEVHLLMALVYRQENKRKEAIKHIYQSLKTLPDNWEAHYLMALLLYETNETAQAGAEIDKVIQLGIKTFNVYTLKGRLAILDRNYKVAIKNYEEALKLNPTNNAEVQTIRAQTEALKNYVSFQERKDKDLYTRPKVLNRPRPNYTIEARQKNVQGIVKLYALVDETGRIKSTFLLNSLGYGLDEEAILAVLQLQFQPATKDGIPVPFWVTLEVEFRLGR